MFVLNLKFSKTTAVYILLLAAAILALIVCAIANSGNKGTSANNEQDAAAYLESLGWQVDMDAMSQKQVTIPAEFSKVYEQYNSLQKAQGYDLYEYRGQEATIFTFPIDNYSGYSGSVVAEIYICKGKIIGGDIHSLELDGFMHGLRRSSGVLARSPASETA